MTSKTAAPRRPTDRKSAKQSPEERSAHARRAALASHSIAAYVRRIVRDAPKLTAEDIEALRAIVLPTESAVFAAGITTGVKMAAEHLARLHGQGVRAAFGVAP